MKTVSEMLKGASQSETTDEGDQVDEREASPDDAPIDPPESVPAKTEAPKGDIPTAPPVVQHDEVSGLRKALEAERRKRQEAERLAQTQSKQEPPQVPDVLTDQEGFTKHMQEQFEQKLVQERVSQSDEFARAQFADYLEVMGLDEETGAYTAWIALMEKEPHLREKFRNSSSPAKFAYEAVKRDKALNEIGDPLTARERIEAEIRAKLEREFAEKQARAKVVQQIPETLVDEPSKSSRKGPEWSGPKPLKELLGGKKR